MFFILLLDPSAAVSSTAARPYTTTTFTPQTMINAVLSRGEFAKYKNHTTAAQIDDYGTIIYWHPDSNPQRTRERIQNHEYAPRRNYEEGQRKPTMAERSRSLAPRFPSANRRESHYRAQRQHEVHDSRPWYATDPIWQDMVAESQKRRMTDKEQASKDPFWQELVASSAKRKEASKEQELKGAQKDEVAAPPKEEGKERTEKDEQSSRQSKSTRKRARSCHGKIDVETKKTNVAKLEKKEKKEAIELSKAAFDKATSAALYRANVDAPIHVRLSMAYCPCWECEKSLNGLHALFAKIQNEADKKTFVKRGAMFAQLNEIEKEEAKKAGLDTPAFDCFATITKYSTHVLNVLTTDEVSLPFQLDLLQRKFAEMVNKAKNVKSYDHDSAIVRMFYELSARERAAIIRNGTAPPLGLLDPPYYSRELLKFINPKAKHEPPPKLDATQPELGFIDKFRSLKFDAQQSLKEYYKGRAKAAKAAADLAKFTAVLDAEHNKLPPDADRHGHHMVMKGMLVNVRPSVIERGAKKGIALEKWIAEHFASPDFYAEALLALARKQGMAEADIEQLQQKLLQQINDSVYPKGTKGTEKHSQQLSSMVAMFEQIAMVLPPSEEREALKPDVQFMNAHHIHKVLVELVRDCIQNPKKDTDSPSTSSR